MTRRNTILLYSAIAFVTCVILILVTAYNIGADPLHPRSRHIWLLSLVAALYASVRGAMIVERMTHGQGLPGLFRKQHAIDKRMAARRRRVEAAEAKAKAAANEAAPGDD